MKCDCSSPVPNDHGRVSRGIECGANLRVSQVSLGKRAIGHKRGRHEPRTKRVL